MLINLLILPDDFDGTLFIVFRRLFSMTLCHRVKMLFSDICAHLMCGVRAADFTRPLFTADVTGYLWNAHRWESVHHKHCESTRIVCECVGLPLLAC